MFELEILVGDLSLFLSLLYSKESGCASQHGVFMLFWKVLLLEELTFNYYYPFIISELTGA